MGYYIAANFFGVAKISKVHTCSKQIFWGVAKSFNQNVCYFIERNDNHKKYFTDCHKSSKSKMKSCQKSKSKVVSKVVAKSCQKV